MADLPTLPFDEPDPLDIAPRLRELQAVSPVTRVRTRTGDEAWLVTRYEDVRALFADPRLGRTHPSPERAARFSQSVLLGGSADNNATEDVDHARMRSRLMPCFSARRMRALAPRVEGFVDDLLDELAAGPPEADLHAALAFPLPLLVICELLGVPYADRDRIHALSTGMADLVDRQRSADSLAAMVDYLRGLVVRKRAEPSADVLSELIATEDGDLSDEDVAGLGAVLLFAGHETTVARIDIGTLLLLDDDAQRAALVADPAVVPAAVEELLRLSVTSDGAGGLPRYARTDLMVGGVRIAAGDAVLLALGAANRDGAAFAEPDRLDLARPQPSGHLSFGYGARYCVGSALARIELTAVFARLFQRFPTLRLAKPVRELRMRGNLLTGGFTELPVTW